MFHFLYRSSLALGLCALFSILGCSSNSEKASTGGAGSEPTTGGAPKEANENRTVVVYSPHGNALENDVKTRFEAEYKGWTLLFVDLSGGIIFSRVRGEKDHPGADAWWGGAPLDFKRAEAAGLLEPYKPAWADALPAEAKSPTFGWTATFRTPEVIMFNEKKVKKEEVPTQWEGLLDPKWKGRIVVRDVRGSSTMKTIFGSLLWREQKRTGKEENGFEFLRKLDANTGQYTGTPETMYEALDKDGPGTLTLWNLADALLLKNSRNFPFGYVVPKPTPIPVEPVALIKNGPNPAGAKMFYDFINRPEQLILMAKERYRVPARTDLPKEQLPEWMRDLQIESMPVEWSVLEEHLEEWISRWDAEIKGKSAK